MCQDKKNWIKNRTIDKRDEIVRKRGRSNMQACQKFRIEIGPVCLSPAPHPLSRSLSCSQGGRNVQKKNSLSGIVLAVICWSPSAQRRCHPTGRCAHRPSVTSWLSINFSLSLSLSRSQGEEICTNLHNNNYIYNYNNIADNTIHTIIIYIIIVVHI